MKPEDVKKLLEQVARGEIEVARAMRTLEMLPFEDLGFATVDHHRALRTGVAEVVYGASKTPEQIARIIEAISARGQTALVTRVEGARADQVVKLLPPSLASLAKIEPVPRLLVLGPPAPVRGRGIIAVVSAGTADEPVAEEAARTAEILGNEVVRVRDVGVAGLHRLLAQRALLEKAEVVIAVAGMEGALASVITGLI